MTSIRSYLFAVLACLLGPTVQQKRTQYVRGGGLAKTSITDLRIWSGECWGEMPIATTWGPDVISLQQFKSVMMSHGVMPCIATNPKNRNEGSYLFCVQEDIAKEAQDVLFADDQINRTCLAYVRGRENNFPFRLPRPYKIWRYMPTDVMATSAFASDAGSALKRLYADSYFQKLRKSRSAVRVSMCARRSSELWSGRVAYDIFFDFGDGMISRFQVMPTGPIWFVSTVSQSNGPEEMRSDHDSVSSSDPGNRHLNLKKNDGRTVANLNLTTMSYDKENRLVTYAASGTSVSYTYSGDDLKRVEWKSGTPTTLVWDGQDYLQGRA